MGSTCDNEERLDLIVADMLVVYMVSMGNAEYGN